MSEPAAWRSTRCAVCGAHGFGPDGAACPFGHGEMRPVVVTPARKLPGPSVPGGPRAPRAPARRVRQREERKQ